jgi:uncharacterized protein with von Willebrand factor type A (vWA) domain
MLECKLCDRCKLGDEDDLLKQIADSDKRSLQDILGQAQHKDSPVNYALKKERDERLKQAAKKLEDIEMELLDLEDDMSYHAMDDLLDGETVDAVAAGILADDKRQELMEEVQELKWQPEDVNEQDIRSVLQQYERDGLIDIRGGKVKITSRGAKRLANRALERIMTSLSKRDIGSHETEETGFGSLLSLYTRPYEAGDDYSVIDIEKSLLNSVKRRGTLVFDVPDLEVHDEIHESKLSAGVLIDKSSSMKNNDKLKAASDTALALSALIGHDPKEKVKVFVFSETVKEIPVWNIPNELGGGGSTDIRAAMRAFRQIIKKETGEKQAYLITDTEPNTEDGRYVGFERAEQGLIEEALLYRRDNIGLNIIMLDESPKLRHLATVMAEKNVGRVFFSSPKRLGEVLVKDFLRRRRH